MRFYLIIVLAFFSFIANAQQDYSTLIQNARAIEEDSTQQRQALNLYLEAFNTYPDSITENDQYWFTVLAAALKENDLAFKYLIPLAQLERDEGGFPGWDLIVGEYSEEDYLNLFSDERWEKLEREALKDQERFYKALREREDEFYYTDQTHLNEIEDPEMLFREIKKFNPYTSKQDRDYSILYDINDSSETSFFIHLPANYTPEKKYPLLVFLHGAVRGNSLSSFQTAEMNLGGWNRYHTKYADRNSHADLFFFCGSGRSIPDRTQLFYFRNTGTHLYCLDNSTIF